jgi:hypothetical protein
LVLLVTVVGIPIPVIMTLPAKPAQPTPGHLAAVLAIVATSLVVMLAICLIKGPRPPRWRWGKKPTDNPDEDF